jgi:hypothetical protein
LTFRLSIALRDWRLRIEVAGLDIDDGVHGCYTWPD